MTLLLLALLSYLALVLDSGSGTWSLPGSAVPQFLYLVAAAAVLTCRGAGAVVVAAVTGLIADVVHGGPLGLGVVLLANLSFLSQLAKARQFKDSVMTSAAFILIYVAIAGIAGAAIQDVLESRVPRFDLIGNHAVSRAGGTVVLYLAIMVCWGVAARSVRRIIPRRRLAVDRPKWAQ